MVKIKNVLSTFKSREVENLDPQANNGCRNGDPLVPPPRPPNRRYLGRPVWSAALRKASEHHICDQTRTTHSPDCVTRTPAKVLDGRLVRVDAWGICLTRVHSVREHRREGRKARGMKGKVHIGNRETRLVPKANLDERTPTTPRTAGVQEVQGDWRQRPHRADSKLCEIRIRWSRWVPMKFVSSFRRAGSPLLV